MLRLALADIERNRSVYPSGFADALLHGGKIDGDTLLIPPNEFQALAERFKRTTGLGDLVHRIAQPIARAIDSTLGTDIEHCGGCAKRRERLNSIRLANPVK